MDSDTEGVSMYLFYDIAVAYLAGAVGRYSGVVTPDPLETLEEIRNFGMSSSNFPPDFGGCSSFSASPPWNRLNQ